MAEFTELVQWCFGSFWRWFGVLLWLGALGNVFHYSHWKRSTRNHTETHHHD